MGEQSRAAEGHRPLNCQSPVKLQTKARKDFTITEKAPKPWNNGKEVSRLDLTSLTTPGQQIHKFDHTRTANLCDWLLCRSAAVPLVGCLLFIYISQLLRDSFSVSQQPPIWEPPSHYSMFRTLKLFKLVVSGRVRMSFKTE